MALSLLPKQNTIARGCPHCAPDKTQKAVKNHKYCHLC
nr:MAG TPA: PriA DNA helicase Cys-rich region (CRR) domain [Caudoviricetes sp.]